MYIEITTNEVIGTYWGEKPIKSKKSSKNEEEQLPGGLYTQAMMVEVLAADEDRTIFSNEL